MSSVRMCDKCGRVFSELEDGWQTFTATTRKRDTEGRAVSVQQILDACSSCAIGTEAPPPAALTMGLDEPVRDALEKRVHELETELGNRDTAAEPEPAAK